MEWLTGVCSSTDAPIQVVYTVEGKTGLPEQELTGLEDYRQSKPVRSGNRAYKQRQLDSFGYLIECCQTYVAQGCNWTDDY